MGKIASLKSYAGLCTLIPNASPSRCPIRTKQPGTTCAMYEKSSPPIIAGASPTKCPAPNSLSAAIATRAVGSAALYTLG